MSPSKHQEQEQESETCGTIDDLDDINVEQLAHMMSYQSGLLRFSETITKKRSFRDASAFLPCVVDPQHYEVSASDRDPKQHAARREYLVNELLRKYASPVEVKTISYDKPLAIIYNPVSGGAYNVREKIRFKLTSHSIEVEFYETNYPLHAWDLAEKEIDLEKFSAIVVVGGDGTLHEVVNGLMSRKENTPPVAFLPNGTGNDTLANFHVNNLDQALEFIVKGETIKMDCNLVLFDANSSEEVPENEQRDRVRYSIANSAAGFVADVNQKAEYLKGYVGRLAYSLTGLKELLFNNDAIPLYDVVMDQPDGSQIKLQNLETLLLFVNNGKYAGGNTSYTPAALLNDGLLDVIFKEGSFNMFEALRILDQASRQSGSHVFRDDVKSYRAKCIRITVKKPDVYHSGIFSSSEPLTRKHMYQIDGESFEFSNFVRIEVVPEAIDVIVDFQQIMARGHITV